MICIEPVIFEDNRGFFCETYKQSEFKENGIEEKFVQDNISYSKKNVIRGLHFQTAPSPQGKLVMALQGQIFDVAVDIRRSSSTFGHWIARELSAANRRMLYIPPGFAHGFCVLSETASVMYKCTAEYAPACERGIRWNDAGLNIEWPVHDPVISIKDMQLPGLQDADLSF